MGLWLWLLFPGQKGARLSQRGTEQGQAAALLLLQPPSSVQQSCSHTPKGSPVLQPEEVFGSRAVSALYVLLECS